ncbi:efflux RND transporter permease subunit, partial [Croceibacter atlanticus]|nr:efflux RND transporter permease subunit [Croceibacter atlanticus]
VRLGAVTHDAEGETVIGIAMMRDGENASAVVAEVKKTIAALRQQLPPGVETVPFYDRSTPLVDRTIRTVEHNLLEGAALVIVVLLLLLGN